jgi:hypothetical protein
MLIEAAKLAPGRNPQLAASHARELERGHRNRATLQVARKLVAYLMAVDKSGPAISVAHLSHSGWPGESDDRCSIPSLSFLRHADLSPECSRLVDRQNGISLLETPVMRHRSDESGRVFLAGCSPAVKYQTDGLDKQARNRRVGGVSDTLRAA